MTSELFDSHAHLQVGGFETDVSAVIGRARAAAMRSLVVIIGAIDMFRRLTDFRFQRTPLEAFGFYLAYLIVGIGIAAGPGFLGGLANVTAGFDAGMMLGAAFAIGICPVLALVVLHAKGQLGNFVYLFVAVLSVAGAAVAGLLLGLVFVAFLTTRPAVGQPEPAEAGPTFA